MIVPTDGNSCLLLSGEFGKSPFCWQLSAGIDPACLQADFTGRSIRSNSKRRVPRGTTVQNCSQSTVNACAFMSLRSESARIS
jgi:hypothetical protein